MKRRNFVRSVALALGGLGLVGCGGNLDNLPAPLQNADEKLTALENGLTGHPSALTIAIINQSAALTSADIEAFVENMNTALSRDFLPLWGPTLGITSAVCQVGGSGDLPVYFADQIQAQGPERSGYHLDTSSAYISVPESNSGGNPSGWTITGSHEIEEALANYYALGTECCDPVEQNSYQIGNQWFTDFMTPFGMGLNSAGSPHADFLQILS